MDIVRGGDLYSFMFPDPSEEWKAEVMAETSLEVTRFILAGVVQGL